MPRSQKPPQYLQHKGPNGKPYARAKLFGRYVSLGPYGSPESYRRHEEVCAQWRAAQEGSAPRPVATGLTIGDLVADFLSRHAEQHYRHADGTPTSELSEYRSTIKPLLRLFRSKLAASFGPLDLKTVRAAMVSGSWLTAAEKASRRKTGHGTTCCRIIANRRAGRIVRLWKWAVSEELIPESVYSALATVQGLAAGRTEARESPDIPPAPEQDIKDTLPCLPLLFRAMALLQLATGMRPGEVCAIRRDEIDRVGVAVGELRVWVIRPDHHKTEHHGITRAVALGPAAQFVLRAWLDHPDDLSAGRQSEWVFPARRKSGTHVTTSGYDHAVLKACRAAGLKETWAPNRLRKSAGTDTEVQTDLETARATLGHTTTATTKRHYTAKADLGKAARAAAKLG